MKPLMSRIAELMRLGNLLRLSFLIILLLIIAPSAHAFTVTPLGDHGNVAVMQVSGDYSAVDSTGTTNYVPRKMVLESFYGTHGNDYDFVVIFTNFDFAMVQPEAKAFYVPLRNTVTGIGKFPFTATAPSETYDFRSTYGIWGMTISGSTKSTKPMTGMGTG